MPRVQLQEARAYYIGGEVLTADTGVRLLRAKYLDYELYNALQSLTICFMSLSKTVELDVSLNDLTVFFEFASQALCSQTS